MKRTFIKDFFVFAAGMLLVLNVACKKDDDKSTSAADARNSVLVVLGEVSDPYWQDVRRGIETE
ncbi:MAG: hypothetical protein KBT04_03970, partial [Bacteroidales bacterium]|nr:hypothetical protein [Candidatus Colimorpha onthohippi]